MTTISITLPTSPVTDRAARAIGAAIAQRKMTSADRQTEYRRAVIMPVRGDASDVIDRLDGWVARIREAQKSCPVLEVVPPSVQGANICTVGAGDGAQELLKHTAAAVDAQEAGFDGFGGEALTAMLTGLLRMYGRSGG